MVIKKAMKLVWSVILFFTLFLSNISTSCIIILQEDSKINDGVNEDSNTPQEANLELPDKVYAFLAPSDVLTFENIYLQSDYMYYFTIEIVTPHTCTAQILVKDPEDYVYQIFDASLNCNEDYMRSYRIPFGTAQSGDYYFQIDVQSECNLNLYIKMEQGLKCLYDKMNTEESGNLVYYNVNKFYNGKYVEHNVELKSDWMYKYFIGRVSAIKEGDDNEVYVDLEIVDPNSLTYVIYTDLALNPIDQINTFQYGTATEGVYTLKMTVRCSASCVNLAYAMADIYKISQEIEANDTEKPDEDEKSEELELFTELGNTTLLPEGYFTALVVAVVASMVIVVIWVKKQKKKNSIELDLKNRQKSK